ncbi:DUF805 domain-containing protein [Eubacterium ramulus]|uniref:DUF805 domain-containing protein n=1 Tax=Eubacterium ramulus TaxID=39490 RepID=UPI00338FA2F8
MHQFGLTRSTNTRDNLDVRSAVQFNDSIEIFCSRDCFHLVTHFQIIQIFSYFSAWQTWFADKITLSTVIFIIINILYFVYDYIIGLKRFHDANHSTIFFVLCFILSFVVIGYIIRMVIYCQPSTHITSKNKNCSG